VDGTTGRESGTFMREMAGHPPFDQISRWQQSLIAGITETGTVIEEGKCPHT